MKSVAVERPCSPMGLDTEILWGSVATALLLAGGLVLFIAPELLALLPRCGVKAMTGVPCPTCGGTRAAMALALGQPVRALWLNPLAALGLLGAGVYAAYAWSVVFGWMKPVRTGWLTPPMPAALRWGAGLLLVANWLYLIAAGR